MNGTLKTRFPLALAVVVITGAVFLAPVLAEKISFAVVKGSIAADREQLAELSSRETLSKLFRAVARTVKPAVVEVRVTKRVRIRQSPMPGMDEFFRHFFGDGSPFSRPRTKRPKRYKEFFSRGLGSGVIVDAENGYVLTNYHVVGGVDEVEVVLADKRKFKAEWVRTDSYTDLAIIKISPENLIAAPLGDSDKMEVGDWVLAIGSPRGFSQTVTAGIVSAKGRKNGSSPYQRFIQTDASINRGNSGGPLVNTTGEVIGINTAISTYSGGSEGIGFAIPSNLAKKVMAQLIDTGKVVRAFMGVSPQDVDENLADSFKLPGTDGALVSGVEPGSAAEKAGIKVGDFIVSVDGKAIGGREDLFFVIGGIEAGKTVDVELYREGKKKTVTVKLSARPGTLAADASPGEDQDEDVGDFGINVITFTEDLARRLGYEEWFEGVAIVGVDAKSGASEKGLKPGMIITRAQGKPVETAGQFRKILSQSSSAKGVRLLVVDRLGMRRFVYVTPTK